MEIEWSNVAAGFGAAALWVLLVVIVCWVVQVCWNHAVVPIWQRPRITKLQAFALLMLVSTLSGAWHGFAHFQYKHHEVVSPAARPGASR